MLERLLPWWQGKLFVLVLLGFVATDFIITITLSAADVTAHVLENPLVPGILDGHQVGVTLFLIALLGGVFLKGFTEAIGIAVGLVAVYLALNLVVSPWPLEHLVANPDLVVNWQQLLTTSYSSPLAMVAVALIVFPKLALGLSGLETGVAVMPLVHGDPADPPEHPPGADPQHPQAADDRGVDHERLPDHQQLRHHGPHPPPGVRGRRPGQRPRPRLPRPPVPWQRLWDRL
jgi:hypothetical protein